MPPEPSHRQWVLTALEENESRLVRFVCRLLRGDGEGARDVVQHAFLRLCDQSAKDVGDHVEKWLFTVCRNRALDLLRASGRLKSLEELERQGLNGHGKTDGDPALRAEEKELAEVLRRMVEHLPAAQREALDLWIEGFSYREIAEIVSKQEGHIRVLVHRGLTNLQEQAVGGIGSPRKNSSHDLNHARNESQTIRASNAKPTI
jgi:RNA polymerase sigma-70 factor (ECF subfamily)